MDNRKIDNRIGTVLIGLMAGTALYLVGLGLNGLINLATPYEVARIVLKCLIPGLCLALVALIFTDD